jgi:hypothetical protein
MKSGILVILTFTLANFASYSQSCTPTGNQTAYGSANIWVGYIYQGVDFNTYEGYVNEGNSQSPNFQANFASSGNVASYSTTSCSILSQEFSIRYMLSENLPQGNYSFTVGGSGGYRLSIDGGSTWVINNWTNQVYTNSAYAVTLPGGNYNMILEYFQSGGQNSLTFSVSTVTIQPLTLAAFNGQVLQNGAVLLDWNTIMEIDNNYFSVQRSGDGVNFEPLVQVPTKQTDTTSTFELQYAYTDPSPLPGTSYYRLQIVDNYGFSSYSKVLQISKEDMQGVKIYPTVVTNSNLTLETDKPIKDARLELFDLSGKKINETDWAAVSGRQSFNLTANSRLASGAYVLLLTSDGNNLLHQLIIVQSN